jgi:hypothetical protein
MRVTARQKHDAGIELLEIAEKYKQFRSDLSDRDALNWPCWAIPTWLRPIWDSP